MLTHVLLIILGLGLLGFGGDILVRGAVGLAKRFNITPQVIGLTVVSAGTSMPELVVSIYAALQNNPDVAAANVIGSNIFNIGLVLGVTGLILSIPIASNTLKMEWPALVVVSLVTTGFLFNLVLSRVEGAVLFLGLVGFTWFMIQNAKARVRRGEAADEFADIAEDADIGALRSLIFLSVGVAGLVLGGKFIVEGAVEIAHTFGVSERIIGLTIVAMGTSLPELAASVAAALKGRSDLAVGNAIGSCIFNLLGIMGLTALVHPLAVDPALLRQDTVWMLVFAVGMGPLIFWGRSLRRVDGLLLILLFSVYMATLVRQV